MCMSPWSMPTISFESHDGDTAEGSWCSVETSGYTFEDRQVVHQNAKEELLSAGLVGAGAQRGAQLPFVLGEGPFDMHSVLVDDVGKPALHLATIAGLRPLASAARVYGDHQGSDTDVSTEFMMRFAVIGHVREDAIPSDSQGTVQEGGSEFGSIIAGPLADRGGHPEITAGVAQDRQLGEGRSQERLRVGSFVPIVSADMAGFVPRGIDRSLGLEIDQATAVSSITDRIEELIEAPFFKRRW